MTEKREFDNPFNDRVEQKLLGDDGKVEAWISTAVLTQTQSVQVLYNSEQTAFKAGFHSR